MPVVAVVGWPCVTLCTGAFGGAILPESPDGNPSDIAAAALERRHAGDTARSKPPLVLPAVPAVAPPRPAEPGARRAWSTRGDRSSAPPEVFAGSANDDRCRPKDGSRDPKGRGNESSRSRPCTTPSTGCANDKSRPNDGRAAKLMPRADDCSRRGAA